MQCSSKKPRQKTVTALRHVIREFGTPATILSDNGSCLVGRGGRKKQTGTWTPTLFENELLNRGIELINSRPYHPQTNGKLERFHHSIEEEIHHYDSLSEYIELQQEVTLLFTGHAKLRDSAKGIFCQKGYRRDQVNKPPMDGYGRR